MKEEKELSFEELIQKLEDITNKLEKDTLNLSDSVAIFEEGMAISKKCSDELENAEKRISIILDTDNLKEENFIPEE